MLDDFFWRAILGGVGLIIVSGPLGCFVVWKRMSYLGDTMSHSALLGVALGFLLGVNITLGVLMVAISIALLLFLLQKRRELTSDAVLGTLSHASLALGVLVISMISWLQIDLMSYLFGDLLAIGVEDLLWIYGGGAIVLSILFIIWRPLLALTVDRELAQAEGVPVVRVELIFMVLIAVVVALAMKMIGMLLVTALLIIPAVTARQFSNTPERMAAVAVMVGGVSVVAGLNLSMWLNTPTGPSIVVSAVTLFFMSLFTHKK
ncbi:MAG: iron chelate uptake ABC transporter family permease subunit [Thiotrichales bacterium]|jgi:zinc transport system permease protein|nr:iron chelate uptake ABC transporter family permease subunit [Thiotrichales bacterium]MBT3613913.1 iron chelate uptake ABC transporter family permease subunit [Thiotrichales bacterium]MBT3752223.1 iron chelate uptake ABC transporter family permease subunit [Thiotrichales bacterium]MBT3836852.1 iron chelate uptake ABC transporter family permease subunit [Thiotrichales bacterium]MBT4151793.1 iron chelate uptake ABC transporter family permease subunit [Thiotrichales bacterium]